MLLEKKLNGLFFVINMLIICKLCRIFAIYFPYYNYVYKLY